MASPSRIGTLSKLRRNQEGSNNSTNTLASSSTSDEPTPDPIQQLSADTGIGKLKNRFRRKSVDERPTSSDSARRFSAFVSGRRNKLNATSATDLSRQLSVNSSNGNLELSGNRSESSLGLEDSGHSSLFTDDNSDHNEKPVRPPLSTHNSHAGYLTLSSPDIKSQTHSVAPDLTTAEVAHRSASTTNIPRIIEPYDIQPLEAPGSVNRSPSPSGRLRGAFSFSRKKSAGETDSIESTDIGQGGLAGVIRPSSRGSSFGGPETLEPEQVEQVAQTQSDKSIEQPANTQARPETPKISERPKVTTASLPETPPNTVETPTTFITPPTPTDPNADLPTFTKTSPTKSSTPGRPSSPSNSIKGRRVNLPSKLSQSIPAPLTPTVEEAKTPGGTLTQPASASGFFSSVFTAAQKAADSLSTTINTSIAANQKSRSITSLPLEEQGGEEVIPGTQSRSGISAAGGEESQQAVKTLGSGDLNLSHLGITQSQGPSPMGSTTDLPSQNGAVAVNGVNQKTEEEAAARAVSEAYQDPIEKVVSQATGVVRPPSVASTDRLTLGPGEGTPPRPGVDDLKRSGSTRSKLSGRRRRHRGSSATAGTGGTIAAGLVASGTGLGNLTVNGAGHRLTGFAVASNKRNKDFHQLFRSVPEDDYLIEDYSAALQRDILLHGRLYVSEGHICFSSNILGWVTNLVISFDEVVSVEKKSTAMIFPNAIVIQTLQARNTFASFVARDSTYELLIGIWKISHPNLKSSLNGVTLDNAGTGDKTEVADPEGSEGSEDTGSEDEVYDEDEDDDAGSFEDATAARSITGSDIGERTLSRQPSGAPLAPMAALPTNGMPSKGLEGADAIVAGAAAGADFPGPPTHEPTQCTDGAEHYDKPLTDETIPAPLGKVYSMVFGPAMGTFMRRWLVEDQKSRELNLADSKTGLDNEHKTLTLDYIKPLNAPVGPKQTKCITTYTLVAFDLEKVVTVDCSTQTPDVPSGNVFATKTRYCLMWGPGNSTRMIANSTVEWSGKSWLKGPIEKGASDGQLDYVKSLVAALKAAVTTKPPVKGAARKGKRKGKKEVLDAEESIARRESVVAEQQASNWGMLEPIHGLLKPIISLFSPFITSQTIIAVLFVLLIYTWMNPPGRRAIGVGITGYTSPERMAAYEEMWRREESSLWDWLEDRVGLDGIYAPSLENDKRERQKVLAARNMGKKLHDERMNERQMDDAIRVTEQRLSALKDAVSKQKERKAERS